MPRKNNLNKSTKRRRMLEEISCIERIIDDVPSVQESDNITVSSKDIDINVICSSRMDYFPSEPFNSNVVINCAIENNLNVGLPSFEVDNTEESLRPDDTDTDSDHDDNACVQPTVTRNLF